MIRQKLLWGKIFMEAVINEKNTYLFNINYLFQYCSPFGNELFFNQLPQKEMKQSYMNSLQLFTGDINMELKNISNFLTSFVNQTETRKILLS